MIRTITTRFDSRYGDDIRYIRHQVFSLEQGIDPNVDCDGRDPAALHVLIEMKGQHVGTGRMLPDGHIGRLAVLAPYRRRGLGRRIIETLVAEARNANLERVFLGAQKQAVAFYQQLDFQPYGEPFQEVGIEHLHMQKILT